MSIYIAMSPTPQWFHVPTKSEFDAVLNILGNWTPWQLLWYLDMPQNWVLSYSNGNLIASTEEWRYWTSTRNSSSQAYAYLGVYDAMSTQSTSPRYIWYWASIRPFKDEYVPNTWDWWTDVGKGIYWNTSLWLITIPSLSITLADKNIWASKKWQVWYYFQRWNSYWFIPWAITTSPTAVSAAWFWPWKYYFNDKFITQATWETSNNSDLWWVSSTPTVPPEISSVYLWTNSNIEVYAWVDKIRPIIKDATIEWLLVWWGGAWGRARCRAWGWGGAGGLIYCASETLPIWTCCCVVIWAWGTGAASSYNPANYKWGNSCFGSVVAYWGWGWGWMCAYNRWCAWAAWGSGWWGAACNAAWGTRCDASYGNCGWAWYNTTWGWGWGAWGAWCPANWAGNYYWWAWWCWCTSSISGVSVVYAAGWGWGGCTGRSNSQWGGCGWCYRVAWCAATTYWSWWGWAWCTASNTCCMAWGSGCQWVFIARYPSNCKFNVTWGTKYECNWYCIHCFTSNWTLTVS